MYGKQVPAYVAKGKVNAARTATGGLRAYEEIQSALLEEVKDEPVKREEPFVDPAARRMEARS